MKTKALLTHLKSTTNLAFLIVVVAAYISTLGFNPRSYQFSTIILLLALGLLYIVIGIPGLYYLERFRPPLGPYLYLVIQAVLGGAIIYYARGNAWLLLMPLSSQTVFLFPRREMLFANLLILAAMLFSFYLLFGDLGAVLQFGISFSTGIVFVIIFTQLMVNEQKARAEVERLAGELGQANQKLREYTVQVEELSAAQERNRLAREIHDGLGHYLTAIHIQIKAAAAVMEMDPAQAQEALEKAQTLAQDALADVRRSVAALRGVPALSRPLPDAIAPLVEEVSAAGIVTDYSVCGTLQPLPPPVELTLYRTVQEGLTNVRKHSLASRVQVTLEYLPEAVKLSIQDNGVGLASNSQEAEGSLGGFGLFGLRERTHLLGGTVQISTTPGQGFRLEVKIPTTDDRQ